MNLGDGCIGVRDFQLFVYNGNAFLFSGYPLGMRYADKLAGCQKVMWEICRLPKSGVGNLLAAQKWRGKFAGCQKSGVGNLLAAKKWRGIIIPHH